MPLHLIPHVGLPKTGTTYLESSPPAPRTDLAWSGVFIPESVGAEPGQHAPILRDVVGRRRWQDEISRSQDQLPLSEVLKSVATHDAHTLVLYAEVFSPLPSEAVRLVDSIDPATLHVVGFGRSLVAWVESARSQVLRTGNPHNVSVDFAGFSRSSAGLDSWCLMTQLFRPLRSGPRTTCITLCVLMEGECSLSLFAHATSLTPSSGDQRALNRRPPICDQPRACAVAAASRESPRCQHRLNFDPLAAAEN